VSKLIFFSQKEHFGQKRNEFGINLALPLTISKSKLKHFRKIENLDLEIVEKNSNYNLFWELVLEPRLQEKYNAKPVHTLQEITKLKSNFPDNIKQFLCIITMI
jgi:hypothetical protein